MTQEQQHDKYSPCYLCVAPERCRRQGWCQGTGHPVNDRPAAPLPEIQPREGDDHPRTIAPLKGDTPRTDAIAPHLNLSAHGMHNAAWALRNLARQLEREVIAWQRQAKAMARAADNEKRRADAAPLSAIGQRTELTGGGSASLNGWPGNRGTAPQGVQECRENSGAADGGERPAPLSTSGTLPLDPTPAMIEAGAQRLVRWEDGCKWPDSWSSMDVRAARNDAERCWRSMWLEATGSATGTPSK